MDVWEVQNNSGPSAEKGEKALVVTLSTSICTAKVKVKSKTVLPKVYAMVGRSLSYKQFFHVANSSKYAIICSGQQKKIYII